MMLNNTWFPKEVDMTRDVNDYKHLTTDEKRQKATYVIDNTGTLQQLEAECDRVIEQILREEQE